MIISLSDAQAIDPKITQDDLDAFESSIRRLTNNNFQNNHIRFENVVVASEDTVQVTGEIIGLRVGDTVEVNYSRYNDGLYTIKSITGDRITFEEDRLHPSVVNGIILTKVEYPLDIKMGVKKLIDYDLKMGDKVGIKSETISRMSTTYYDINSKESVEGYPASLLSFVNKYQKMRW